MSLIVQEGNSCLTSRARFRKRIRDRKLFPVHKGDRTNPPLPPPKKRNTHTHTHTHTHRHKHRHRHRHTRFTRQKCDNLLVMEFWLKAGLMSFLCRACLAPSLMTSPSPRTFRIILKTRTLVSANTFLRVGRKQLAVLSACRFCPKLLFSTLGRFSWQKQKTTLVLWAGAAPRRNPRTAPSKRKIFPSLRVKILKVEAGSFKGVVPPPDQILRDTTLT